MPHGVAQQVDDHALEEARISDRAGQVGREIQHGVGGAEVQLVEGGEHDVVEVDVHEPHAEHAGLHAADVEEVGDEVGERAELSSAVASSSSRSPSAHVMPGSGAR